MSEHLVIWDEYKVLEYDIRNHLIMRDDTVKTEYDGSNLIVNCTHEEEVLEIIRFLVVNGYKFSYSFRLEENNAA